MAYREIDTTTGVLGIDNKGEISTITTHRGRDVFLSVPEDVTNIGRKAFLSDRYLHRVEIPESVTEIGDWAFAGCRSLEQISLHRNITFGNGVFKDCENLKQVLVSDLGEELSEKAKVDISFLLAAVIRLLEDKYLFDLSIAGSDEWLENWDRRMDRILDEPDDEGFIVLLACGEEDYEGRDNTLDSYLSRRRARKVRICFIRLLHDYGLSEDRKARLIQYLYSHRAGAKLPLPVEDGKGYTDDGHMGRMHVGYSQNMESLDISDEKNLTIQDETWQIVLREHPDEEEYYHMMNKCGCITKDNLEIMLYDLGERHARMKAYLLGLNIGGDSNDFFSGLEL